VRKHGDERFFLKLSPPLPVLSLSKGWEGMKGRVIKFDHPHLYPPPSRGRSFEMPRAEARGGSLLLS